MDMIPEQVIGGDLAVDPFHLKEGNTWLDLDPFARVYMDICGGLAT